MLKYKTFHQLLKYFVFDVSIEIFIICEFCTFEESNIYMITSLGHLTGTLFFYRLADSHFGPSQSRMIHYQ